MPDTPEALSVSAVIPTHKRSESLIKAIASVRAQTFPCAEIIVVSDGFDQPTDDYMKRLQAEDPRVRYRVVDPPRGGNHARNTGVSMAETTHVAFLDDDDEWLPEKIERQVALLKADAGIGLVCTAIYIVDNTTKDKRISVPSASRDASREILSANRIGTTSSVMVKRSIHRDAGGFDEQLKAKQDYELWIRICQLTGVGVVREPSLNYYDDLYGTQISSNTQKYIDASLYILEKHRGLMISKLGESGYRRRQGSMFAEIAKRANRNRQPGLAREYALKAMRHGNLKGGAAWWALSFVPPALLRKLYTTMVSRKVSKAGE